MLIDVASSIQRLKSRNDTAVSPRSKPHCIGKTIFGVYLRRGVRTTRDKVAKLRQIGSALR
jgi:hypothetical protein